MSGKVSLVLVAAWIAAAVVACAASDSKPMVAIAPPSNVLVMGGLGAGGSPSTTAGPTRSGLGTAGTAQNPQQVVGTGGSGAVSAGGAGVLGGTGGVRAGSAGGAVGAAGAGPGPGRSGGTEPVIPAPMGDCPPMVTGPFAFMGVTSQIWVGTKSDTQKGPIMVYWHGTGGSAITATAELDPTLVSEIMAQGGVIGSIEGGLMGDTLDWGVFTTGDYKSADQVVACAVQQLNIDTKRIYTSGASAGGLAAGEMAYGRSSYVAATLPNSGGQGGYPMNMVLNDPTHVPAAMTMHGAKGVDMVVIDFGDASLREDNDIVAKGGFAIDCDHGGGHVAAPPDLKAAGWVFLKAHPFGVNPFPYAGGLPAGFPAYCKIITK